VYGVIRDELTTTCLESFELCGNAADSSGRVSGGKANQQDRSAAAICPLSLFPAFHGPPPVIISI